MHLTVSQEWVAVCRNDLYICSAPTPCYLPGDSLSAAFPAVSWSMCSHRQKVIAVWIHTGWIDVYIKVLPKAILIDCRFKIHIVLQCFHLLSLLHSTSKGIREEDCCGLFDMSQNNQLHGGHTFCTHKKKSKIFL